MNIAYYPGCTLKASSSLYDVQTRQVFGEMDIQLVEIEDWNCCGATSAGKVNDFLAVAMPARNLGIAESQGFSEMVIPCSACYSRTLVAQKQLDDNAVLMAEINSELTHKVRGTIKVSSILEVLLTKVSSGELAEKAVRKLTGIQACCYYGCLQTRFPYRVPVPDDVENPQGMETVLKTLGAKPLDWSYKTDCCGASASVNDEQTALTLMARILKDAVARGANCLVVTCPLCQLNLDAYQDRVCKKFDIQERLPVFFITEMIGLAMGMDIEALQIDRHFIDGSDLLKELNLI
ncbi:MAG: CoB--CoM heterodisulfide reductase iron-sulfur subunit B family protein [Deltaproteobacteria bacterium]|nr:CoB--CoM heterodisulfide reductase iron-sulfur subunit B family protein [Deltaproteobacteria bacterium]